jgi:hypothetical protein
MRQARVDFLRSNGSPPIHKHAVRAGVTAPIGNHTFQATGITNFLENGGALERAQDMAAHACLRTTGRIRLFSMEGEFGLFSHAAATPAAPRDTNPHHPVSP